MIFKFIYLTLFPSFFNDYFETFFAKKKNFKKSFDFLAYNLRDFAYSGKVDDYVYGGGPGMLLKIEPLTKALERIKEIHSNLHIILVSPQGRNFTQKDVRKLLELNKNLVFVCGRYEGFDARIINYIDEEISIGEFITIGGELPALILTEAIIRALPGMIKENSYLNESFTKEGELDYDSYTRPNIFDGIKVPEVLLSGNHKLIDEWREENKKNKSLKRKKSYK